MIHHFYLVNPLAEGFDFFFDIKVYIRQFNAIFTCAQIPSAVRFIIFLVSSYFPFIQ